MRKFGNTPPMSYREFLLSKIPATSKTGFEIITDADLNPDNFPHQNAAIKWALQMGRALIAASFGLGKTRIQSEIARIVVQKTGKKFLLICPLGVKYQFVNEDGPILGMKWQYVTDDESIKFFEREDGAKYFITNYERVRDGNITPAKHDFAGVSLDEGSVIHSFGSKTTQEFKRLLKDIPYRFVATATPAPNEYREIIYYADFLGIKDTGQILTRWFKRNPDKAGDLQINPLHEKEFWLWVASWALFLYKPSDLGYSDEGYELPKRNIILHRIKADQTRAFRMVDRYGQHRLLLDASSGVTEASAEVRETIYDRVAECKRIIEADEPDKHWLIWHYREAEREVIAREIPNVSSVYGSQDIDIREKLIMQFAHGQIPILSTKPVIAGSGCNFQYHCADAIFIGPDYKFKDFIQAVHRIYRFQQTREVNIHIIYTESQDAVMEALQRKWQQHDELVDKMRSIIREYKLSLAAIVGEMSRSLGVQRQMSEQKLFTAVNNDCIAEVAAMPDNSVDMIMTSIPFGNHYEYTETLEDLGHNPTDLDFWKQMDYLTPQLLRVLKPGRIAVIHVKDRVVYRYQTESEMMEISPFTAECIMHFRDHKWMFFGTRTIVTDVVRENNSSYRLGWSEACKDMTKMGSGLPEYALVFRKRPTDTSNSYADEPVEHKKEEFEMSHCPKCGHEVAKEEAKDDLCKGCMQITKYVPGYATGGYSRGRWQTDAHSFWRSDGNTPLDLGQLYNYFQDVATKEALDRKNQLSSTFMVNAPQSPHGWVLTDVDFMHTFNSEQVRKKRSKHICPLPFDIVTRFIEMYSNKGDVVLDPFGGLFTVPVTAMRLGRKGYGIELNPDYYAAGVKYCEAEQRNQLMPTLFDFFNVKVGEG